MSEAELMQALGSTAASAEGRFFPDTYVYSRGVSDLTRAASAPMPRCSAGSTPPGRSARPTRR